MTTCENDNTAKYIAGSLLKHARSVYNYAKAYCEETDSNSYIDAERRRAFRSHLTHMLAEMHELMLLADQRGMVRFCNHEQIQAYIDGAKGIIQVPNPRLTIQ